MFGGVAEYRQLLSVKRTKSKDELLFVDGGRRIESWGISFSHTIISDQSVSHYHFERWLDLAKVPGYPPPSPFQNTSSTLDIATLHRLQSYTRSKALCALSSPEVILLSFVFDSSRIVGVSRYVRRHSVVEP